MEVLLEICSMSSAARLICRIWSLRLSTITPACRFSIISPGEQFRRYGLGVFGLWVKIFHFIDIGHFVWARPAAERQDRPVLQWWGNVFANVLVVLLALWQGNGFRSVDPIAFVALPLMVVLFFGVRQLAMRLTAKSQGLEVRYRAWESGFPMSIAIALFTGNLFTMPGGRLPYLE